MNRFKTALVCAGLLCALANASSAFGCTPPPAYVLEAVTVQESKLPLRTPQLTPPPMTGMCPTQVWPFQFDGLTDDQIAQYLGDGTSSGSTTPSYPAWNATAVYVGGDSVSYNGKNYRARWWTQGEAPPGASGVWEELTTTTTGGNPPAWSSSTAYAGGAQVTYQSNIYQAKWWTQGEVPGTQWSAWELVGPAGSGGSERPAMFHASANFSGYDANNVRQMQVIWSTDPFSLDTTPAADNWKVRVNGIVVQQGTNLGLAIADCTGTTSCGGVRYMQAGSFTIPAGGTTDQVTFWLCKGDVCRMTPRLNWYVSGASVSQKPPF